MFYPCLNVTLHLTSPPHQVQCETLILIEKIDVNLHVHVHVALFICKKNAFRPSFQIKNLIVLFLTLKSAQGRIKRWCTDITNSTPPDGVGSGTILKFIMPEMVCKDFLMTTSKVEVRGISCC